MVNVRTLNPVLRVSNLGCKKLVTTLFFFFMFFFFVFFVFFVFFDGKRKKGKEGKEDKRREKDFIFKV